ncbi:MAG: hypothetical protein IMZ64_05370, partial [Bacteroidetes bacterium]|nr:hypothetical protein [Bacteroidota bacterium]
ENPFDASNQPIVFTVADPSGSHDWNFGDGTTDIGTTVSHTFPVPVFGGTVPYLVDHTIGHSGNYDSTVVILNIVNPLPSENLHRVIYSSTLGGYIGVGDNAFVVTSPDGTNWTPQNIGGLDLYDVVDNGSLLVAVGAEGTVATSADGTNWAFPSTGMPTTGEDGTYSLASVIWDGTQFVTCCSLDAYPYGTSFYISADSSTWALSDGTLSNIGFGQIVQFDGGYYVGGMNNVDYTTSFYFSTDRTSWAPESPAIPGFTVRRFNIVNGQLFGCGAFVSCSIDAGIFVRTAPGSFSKLTLLPAFSIFGSVIDIAPLTSAVKHYSTIQKLLTQQNILDTTDLSTWSMQSITGVSGQLLNMCYNSGLYVATSSDAKIYNSSDASSWTQVFG